MRSLARTLNDAGRLLGCLRHLPETHSSAASAAAWRDRRAAKLAQYVARHVPYYRDLFRRHALDPASIRSVDDLRRIPVSTRTDLKKRPLEDLVSDEYDPRRLVAHTTSGSSGIPFAILRSWFDERCLNAFWLKHIAWQGVRPWDRIATLTAIRVPHATDRILAEKALNAVGAFRNAKINSLLPVEEIVRVLEGWRPERLMGYPGALLRVGEAMRSARTTYPGPKSIHTFGEVMTSDMREKLTSRFVAPIYDIYGSYEFGMAAYQCHAAGVYHVADEAIHLEVLRDGAPVAEGETGVLTATNLVATAMPFIRFDIGDRVTRGPNSCPCGRETSTIREIQGRMVDMFQLPGGRQIHPYEIVFELLGAAFRSTFQYQLVQETARSIVLYVVPASPQVGASDFAAVSDQVASRLGDQVTFEVRLVDRIDFEPSGKFRLLRSNVRSYYEDEGRPA